MNRRRVRRRRRGELAREPLDELRVTEQGMVAVAREEAPAERVEVDEGDAVVRPSQQRRAEIEPVRGPAEQPFDRRRQRVEAPAPLRIYPAHAISSAG